MEAFILCLCYLLILPRIAHETYILILEKLYSVDYMKAFEESCEMARYCGVPVEEVLDSKESIEVYFLK